MSIRHSLLALLSEGPKYGFQLRQEFEASTGEVWPLNVGQVYTTLQRLERDGLAHSDDVEEDERQKNYRITELGGEELARWLRTPPDLSEPPRDELVIKVLVASRLPDVDVYDVIQVHRRYIVQLMQQWTHSERGRVALRPRIRARGRRRALPIGRRRALARRRRWSTPPRRRSRRRRRTLWHYRAFDEGLEHTDEHAGTTTSVKELRRRGQRGRRHLGYRPRRSSEVRSSPSWDRAVRVSRRCSRSREAWRSRRPVTS